MAKSGKLVARNPHAADKVAESVERILIIAFCMHGRIDLLVQRCNFNLQFVYHYTEHIGVLRTSLKHARGQGVRALKVGLEFRRVGF